MNELSLRKQALILESCANRLAVRTEAANLKSAAAGVFNLAQRGNWWTALAPVAAYLASRWLQRRGDSNESGNPRFKWIQRLFSFWQNVSAGPVKPGVPPSA